VGFTFWGSKAVVWLGRSNAWSFYKACFSFASSHYWKLLPASIKRFQVSWFLHFSTMLFFNSLNWCALTGFCSNLSSFTLPVLAALLAPPHCYQLQNCHGCALLSNLLWVFSTLGLTAQKGLTKKSTSQGSISDTRFQCHHSVPSFSAISMPSFSAIMLERPLTLKSPLCSLAHPPIWDCWKSVDLISDVTWYCQLVVGLQSRQFTFQHRSEFWNAIDTVLTDSWLNTPYLYLTFCGCTTCGWLFAVLWLHAVLGSDGLVW